jgi:hypothetical protein
MKTTDHRAELEALMAYLDGELSGVTAESVRAHLATCAECQQVEGEMTDVAGRLKAWEVDAVPSMMSAPGTTSRGPLRRWLPLAASVVLMAGAGLAWLATAQKDRPSVDTAAAVPASTISGRPIESMVPEAAPPVPEPPRMMIPLAGSPRLVRTARLTVVTDRFDASRAEMDALVRRLEGFTGRILVTGTVEQGRALSATLQIPSPKLDEAMTGLKALGRVTSEGADGEDVTQHSIDLDARLSNARNSEKRLAAILEKRTGDLSDVLAVEREIARVRGEIESMEAQRTSLDRRITYATIELQLTEEKRAAVDLGPQPLSTRFVDEFVRGWNGVLTTAVQLGLLAARLAPATVVLAFLVAPWLLRRRRAV